MLSAVIFDFDGIIVDTEPLHYKAFQEVLAPMSLGYSWDEVHTEAERLEHVISEDFEERIAAALGYPSRDPHGEPIPSSDLVMPTDGSVPLASLEAGQTAVVRRVEAHDVDLLRHLEGLRLIPGARVRVLEISPFDHLMHLRAADHRVTVLGPAITSRVFVEVV